MGSRGASGNIADDRTELTLRGSRVCVGRLRLCTFSVRLRGIIYPRVRRAAIVRTAMGVQ
jgi:hypothetical protein